MTAINRFTSPLMELDTFKIFSDFWMDQNDTEFIDTITDSGTALMSDEAGGIAVLTPSDGTVADNDEVYLASPNANFLYAVGKPLYGKCRLRFTETSATIYNVGFFFQNAVGADSIIDNGGGLKTSGSTLGIFKVDGGAVWKCVSACNGTATTNTSTASAVTATWYELEIMCEDWDGVSMQVAFKVNGEYLKDSTTGSRIYQTVAIASAAQMQVGVGAKLGAITNNDTTKVDYIYAHQKR